MALFISQVTYQGARASTAKTQRRTGHTRARTVSGIDLSQPGRLRVGHLLTLFSVSHSTLYSHIKAGKIPKPDGMDGSRPFWLTETVVRALTPIAPDGC